jgi:hypothetical protein
MAFTVVPTFASVLQQLGEALGATRLVRGWTLDRMYWREFDTVMRELGCFTDRELACDLRMGRSDVAGVAATEADLRVSRFVRDHHEYRSVAKRHGHGQHLVFG